MFNSFYLYIIAACCIFMAEEFQAISKFTAGVFVITITLYLLTDMFNFFKKVNSGG